MTIKKSGNVMFTEVLDEIKENTETLIDNSEQMLIEKRIARLDRDWENQKSKYKIYGKNGVSSLPDEKNNILGIMGFIVTVMFIIFWLSSINSMQNDIHSNPVFEIMRDSHPSSNFSKPNPMFPMFLFFGFFILVGVIIKFVSDSNKTDDFENAKKIYLSKRQKLLIQLEKKINNS